MFHIRLNLGKIIGAITMFQFCSFKASVLFLGRSNLLSQTIFRRLRSFKLQLLILLHYSMTITGGTPFSMVHNDVHFPFISHRGMIPT